MSVDELQHGAPAIGMDVLRLPLLGRFLRGRHGRLALQALLTLFALALVIDGFTGTQSAARNLATVAPWVGLRGLAVIVLLLAGNLFCMGCPFTLPRSLAKRLSQSGARFPQALRNKWLSIFSLFLLFFFYEYLDLWASPWLSAWLIILYFAASFALEALFTESAFCKYVCPLGAFNMVYSTLSPSRIAVKSPDVCASCVGKECVNGSYAAQPVIRVDEIPVAGGGQPTSKTCSTVQAAPWAVARSCSRHSCAATSTAPSAWTVYAPARTTTSVCSRASRALS